jgi:hypothetical protein
LNGENSGYNTDIHRAAFQKSAQKSLLIFPIPIPQNKKNAMHPTFFLLFDA